MASGITMSPSVEMDLFGTKSALFQDFGNYWTRMDCKTHRPRPEPITEFREALVLLYRKMNDGTIRYVDTQAPLQDGAHGPAVVIDYAEGSAREKVFAITPEVFKMLDETRVLREYKRYGWVDPTKFFLDQRGRGLDRLFDEINAYSQEKAAARFDEDVLSALS